MTLVKAEGEQTPVSMVVLTVEQWRKTVKRLKFWNYHDYKHKDEGWFRFQTVQVDIPKGQVKCLAEFLPESANLPRLPENYQEDQAYKAFIDAMIEGIYNFRANMEGHLQGKEK